jgi:DNA repair protein RecN (Recombination protein N)
LLRQLYIRNFAIIDEVEVSFDRGLNVITGETGAGKSILIGALKLVLGSRSSSELVRAGAQKAIVEATFETGGLQDLETLLQSAQVDTGPTLLIRREIGQDHSRAFINDSPVRLDLLKIISDGLIDLHGQHDHQSILRSDTHLPLLDGFGAYDGDLDSYRAVFGKVSTLLKRKHELLGRREELERERALAEFQIAEIDAVKPEPDEESTLAEELRILDYAEQLIQGSQEAFEGLYGGDGSAYDRVSAIIKLLQELERYDTRLSPFVRDLAGANSALADIASFLRDYSPAANFDPSRADEIRERLGAFELLKRKYGGSIESVMQHRERIGELFNTAVSFDESIKSIDAEMDQLSPELWELGTRLSRARQGAAAELQQSIIDELGHLGMVDAQFEVRIHPVAEGNGPTALPPADELGTLEHGFDTCEFYLSANRGEPVKPLVKVASGGETSRIMLALKTILARSDKVSTLVFDEIDTGISGAVAERVGNAMRRLSSGHQVITITHLPQIAAAADSHYTVEKVTGRDRTSTAIRKLDDNERTTEIASLLSGTEISEAALQRARELIHR